MYVRVKCNLIKNRFCWERDKYLGLLSFLSFQLKTLCSNFDYKNLLAIRSFSKNSLIKSFIKLHECIVKDSTSTSTSITYGIMGYLGTNLIFVASTAYCTKSFNSRVTGNLPRTLPGTANCNRYFVYI